MEVVMNKIKRLSDSELEIMLIIWHSETSVSSSYVLDHLQGQLKYKLSTLMTVLSRLTAKGFLACDKQGRNNFYRAIIDEDDYMQSESKSILEKLFCGSFKNLVATLYKGNSISKEDMAELKRFLNEFEEEEQS